MIYELKSGGPHLRGGDSGLDNGGPEYHSRDPDLYLPTSTSVRRDTSVLIHTYNTKPKAPSSLFSRRPTTPTATTTTTVLQPQNTSLPPVTDLPGLSVCLSSTTKLHYPPTNTMSTTPTPPKSILITGGASGIGLALTRHFASQPSRPQIAILDVNAASGPSVAAAVAAEFPGSAVTFHRCDVSSWDEQAEAFARVFEAHGGRLDVVVANAGVSEQGVTTLVRLDDDGGEGEGPVRPRVKTVEVNLLGAIYCQFGSCVGIGWGVLKAD